MSKECKLTKELLEKLYYEEMLSFSAIADKLDMAESTVRYYFKKKYKLKPRSKSQAQKLYLSVNEHQRTGTQHSDESKQKISENSSKFWRSREAKGVKQHIQDRRQEWWQSISDSEKVARLDAMQQGAKERAGVGSHFEECLANFLADKDIHVIQRTDEFTPGHEFIVDMVLPDYDTIIEVDGPVHFKVVFDQETLEKHQMRDVKKNESLTSAGFCIVRVRSSKTTKSQAKCQRVFKQLKPILDDEDRKGQVYIIEAD